MNTRLESLVLSPDFQLSGEEVNRVTKTKFDPFVNHAQETVALFLMGQYKKLKVTLDKQEIGFVLYSIDTYGEDREFFIGLVHILSKEKLILDIRKRIEEYAKFLGCSSVRFHTVRIPLVNVALSEGYRVSEIVMRKTL